MPITAVEEDWKNWSWKRQKLERQNFWYILTYSRLKRKGTFDPLSFHQRASLILASHSFTRNTVFVYNSHYVNLCAQMLNRVWSSMYDAVSSLELLPFNAFCNGVQLDVACSFVYSACNTWTVYLECPKWKNRNKINWRSKVDKKWFVTLCCKRYPWREGWQNTTLAEIQSFSNNWGCCF